MKILWIHTFDPGKPSSGIFMHTHLNYLRQFYNISIDELYLGNLFSIKNFIKQVKLIKAYSLNYDIVHAQYGSGCGLVGIFARSRLKILSIRGSDWSSIQFTFKSEFFRVKLANLITRLSVPFYDRIITVSNRLSREVGFYKENQFIFVLPSPVNLDLFKPMNRLTSRSMLSLSLSDEKYYILFITASINNSYKNLELVERAVSVLKDKYDIEILLVSGIDHKLMPYYINSSNLIVCCSQSEGWPNSIKEALACNIPFVSTDVSDLASISKNTRSCKICEMTVDSITCAINDIILNQKIYPYEDLRKFVSKMNLYDSSRKLLNIYTQ